MSQLVDITTASSAALPAVLQSVKHDTRRLLQERITLLFQNADDALFEMADRAVSDVDQNLYFDSMRIVRLQRASIQEKFISNYSRSWENVKNPTAAADSAPEIELEAEDFSLIQNDELEISVATAGINTKVATMYLLSLTQLTKRIEKVCSITLPAEHNPLGPQCLNKDFVQSMETLDVDIKIRIILLKLFERFVAEQLEEVYLRANNILIEAGVLPKLKHRVQKSAEAKRKTQGTPETAVAYQQLEKLLDATRSTRIGSNYIDQEHGDATLVSTPALLQALGVVQGEASSAPIELDRAPATIDLHKVMVIASGVEGAKNSKLEKPSEDVVDLVRMLFDYILNDRNLAIPMKALIGRLQIPILKVAILDRSFFAKTSHPARQLLNELSSAGIGWSTAAELKRDVTYSKIESIVLRVMNGFSDDLTLFSNLLVELRHFISKEQKKRNQLERRVKETEKGKAKTREAKEIVQALINQKACGLRLPADAGHFVSDAWSRVLVYLFVTQGTESEIWIEALETLDDLLWVVQPLTNEADIKLREQLLPRMLTQLEAGITHANLPEATEQLLRLRANIDNIHAADVDFLEGAAQAEVPRISVAEQPELILVKERTNEFFEPTHKAEVKYLELILGLAEGAWLELKDHLGNMIRCKLATVVQPGDRYVFVNRKGMKVCERSRNALACALQAKELTLLDESEMFDRALEAVIGNLQKMQDTHLR